MSKEFIDRLKPIWYYTKKYIEISFDRGGKKIMQDNTNTKEYEDFEGVSEEAKTNFMKFLEEIKEETANCSVVDHTNHSNHSNW